MTSIENSPSSNYGSVGPRALESPAVAESRKKTGVSSERASNNAGSSANDMFVIHCHLGDGREVRASHPQV